MNDNLIQVKTLIKEFQLPGSLFAGGVRSIRAVDRVSLIVRRGEVYGLVGESGCGKTTLGRMLLYLIKPTSGEVVFDGQSLALLKKEELRRLRMQMQIVFQNPLSSLSPRQKILETVAEPLHTHHVYPRSKVRGKVIELLQQVGLDEYLLECFPHELSGGQCQRIAIARALALHPRLLVLDEPTSALDVSIQAQIINLLEELLHSQGLTYFFISHDLSVVQHISDRIGVMYLGQMLEEGPSEAIFDTPSHPYTQTLLNSIPLAEFNKKREQIVLPSGVPSLVAPPSGCRFHTRCPYLKEICIECEPVMQEIGFERRVACHQFTSPELFFNNGIA